MEAAISGFPINKRSIPTEQVVADGSAAAFFLVQERGSGTAKDYPPSATSKGFQVFAERSRGLGDNRSLIMDF